MNKGPGCSVNSAQRCVKCSRPSDGPNRASYCKQHAHLDSTAPWGRSQKKVNSDEESLIAVCLRKRKLEPMIAKIITFVFNSSL